LIRQEGIIFRHMLRLVLLCGEFSKVPPDPEPAAVEAWSVWLGNLAQEATDICFKIDPQSTQEVAKNVDDAIPVPSKMPAATSIADLPPSDLSPLKVQRPEFGAGLGEDLD
jgi:hypothetical protein